MVGTYFVLVSNSNAMQNADGVQMSCIMRKPDFCHCKNKSADQAPLFSLKYSTISFLLKSKISSF